MKFSNDAFDAILDDRSESYSSSSDLNLIQPSWMKRSTLQKNWWKIALMVACAAALIIIIVTAVVVTKKQENKEKTLRQTQNQQTIYGIIAITNREFTEELKDSQSSAYKDLSKEICNPMTDLVRHGIECQVKQMWKGSVKAYFELKLAEMKVEAVLQELLEGIKRKNVWKSITTRDEKLSVMSLDVQVPTESATSTTTSFLKSSPSSSSTKIETTASTTTEKTSTASTTMQTTAAEKSSTTASTATSSTTTNTKTTTATTTSTTQKTRTSTRTTSAATSPSSSNTTSTSTTPKTTKKATTLSGPVVVALTTKSTIIPSATPFYPDAPGEHIRLFGGSTPYEGRLEVLYNGVWGTVCDDEFGAAEATVACKSLGYGMGVELPGSNFGEGEGPIWLDNVNCALDDLNLFECTHAGWGVHDCDHAEDIAVRCEKTANFTGKLRLTGGPTSFAGRLEVEVGGIWGTVCDDFFNDTVAEVFCGELGLSEEGFTPKAIGGAFFGAAARNVPIFYDDITCPVPDMGVSGCFMYTTNNCRHHEDISLVCKGGSQFEWDIRLVDGTSNSSGHVQVRSSLHTEWGYVCDDYWNTQSAGLVCSDLGFGGNMVLAHSGSYFFGNATETFASQQEIIFSLDDIMCDETMTSLRHCSHLPWGKHNCKSSEIAGVSCVGRTDSIIRLVGNTDSSGRVELFYQGQWGTVCDDEFNNIDASVTCKTLGYDTGLKLTTAAPGSGPIWLDNLKCNYTHQSIFDCPHAGWGVHNCRHDEDVFVSCYNLEHNISAEYLFFTDTHRRNVLRMPAAGGSVTPMGGMTRFINPVAIAHDPVRNYIYWTERASEIPNEAIFKSIKRLSLTTNEIETIPLPTDSVPDGLAVDYISNLLYLTDTGNDVIKVIDFNRRTNKTLLWTGLLEPRAIVVDPESGWMYWSDWGTDADIEKAKMDGTERSQIVTSGINWPNGLALDKPDERLYFCEAKSPRSVQSFTTNGTDRKIHFSSTSSQYHFFGIALDQQYIYLTTWTQSTVLRMLKTTLGATRLEGIGEATSGRVRLNSLVLTGSLYQQPGKNRCSGKNGGCSHYCLPVPGGRVCDCPDSMQLRPNSTTECQNVTEPGFSTPPSSTVNRVTTPPSNTMIHGYTTRFTTTLNTPFFTRVRTQTSLPLRITTTPVSEPFEKSRLRRSVVTQEGESSYSFRLTGGKSASEGRVELFNNITGSWVRVCAKQWNFSEATEICKTLGYDYSIPQPEGYFGVGNGTGFIADCKSGNKSYDLKNCMRPDCRSYKEAALICYGGKENSSAVRLTGGRDETEGRVEVIYKGQWGVVCDDTWSNNLAAIVCKMMGFKTGIAKRESYFGMTNKTIWLDTIYCGPDADNIFGCQNDAWGVTDCENNEEAGVICISDFRSLISLVGDPSRTDRGIVTLRDIFDDENKTGPICAAEFGSLEARIVCQMLGHLTGQLQLIEFGALFNVTGMTWLNSPCPVTALSLYECNLHWNPRDRCIMNQLAAVQCSDEYEVENLMNCTFDDRPAIETKLCPLRNVITGTYKFYPRTASSYGGNTGPCFDNTVKKFGGSYMWIRPSLYGRYRNPGILESRWFYTETKSCLKFHYHMFGDRDFHLKVYANYSTNKGNRTVNLLSLSGNQGEIWYMHQATLEPGQFSIVLHAESSASNIALDDIVLQTQSCKTDISEFSCDFERGTCDIVTGSCSRLTWTHLMTRERTSVPYDHSLKSSSGYVMSLSSSYGSGIFALPLMNITTIAQLSFYYYYTVKYDTTAVDVQARQLGGSNRTLWSFNKEANLDQWVKVDVIVPTGLWQITFTGDIRQAGNFAVDDISVFPVPGLSSYKTEIECNFDHGDICNFTSGMADHGDWKIRNPKIFSQSPGSIGPCRDYSTDKEDGGFLYASLRSRDVVDQPRVPNFVRTQHRLGNAYSVIVSSPKLYVKNVSCLTFHAYLQKSNESGLFVNTSSGQEWWVEADDSRTWREVTIPLTFGLHIVSFAFVSISTTVHSAALDAISLKVGACNETKELGGESLKCNFDNGSFCAWTSSCLSSTGVSWNLGTSKSIGILDNDYNPGTFAFVKNSQPGQYTLFAKSWDLRLTTPHCLSFKYFMKGGAALHVELASHLPDSENLLLLNQNRTTTKWLNGKVDLNGVVNVSRVLIIVISKISNQDFFVAVDAIDITNGTCPIEITGIRLFEGKDRRSGNLQIDMNGVWHEICGYFKDDIAVSVCQVLGHWPLLGGVASTLSYPTPGMPVLPGWLRCPEDATVITNCSYIPCKSCCSHSHTVVSISCRTERPIVRLVQGNRPGAGFLEVYIRNKFVPASVDKGSVICSYIYRSDDFYQMRTFRSLRYSIIISCDNKTDVKDCEITESLYNMRVWIACSVNQTKTPNKTLDAPSCNFENGLCEYQQDHTDEQDWHRISPDSWGNYNGHLTSDTGPEGTNHLRSSSDEWYLHFEASSPSKAGFKARISTPEFNSTGKCLRFFYNLRGIGGSVLRVYQTTYNGTTVLGIYQQTDSALWRWATHPLHHSPASKIMFEGERGTHLRGDIAIDDVEITESCDYGCPGDSFTCSDGSCIPSYRVCDNAQDCHGTISEEVGCSCKDGEFQCANGVCIPGASRCDGIRSCEFPDYSDEKGCECQQGEFRCPNGVCVLPHLVCNSENDCEDWSDEKNCTNCRGGGTSGFLCPGDDEQYCIKKEQRCDGVKDCLQSGADEIDCVDCDFNERNFCNLRTKDFVHFALHPNSTDDYFIWAYELGWLFLTLSENASCLSFQILNQRRDIFMIHNMENHKGKLVSAPAGSWIYMNVTLDPQSLTSTFKLNFDNASLDNIKLMPGACQPAKFNEELNCSFSGGFCGFAAFGWEAGSKQKIRLAGGSSSQGRLEIFVNGTWGTVCDDRFSTSDATVACRSLGFVGGSYRCCARYGRGQGPILWTDVSCTSSEPDFLNCNHRNAGRICVHSEDVSVECFGKISNNDNSNEVFLIAKSNATWPISMMTKQISGMRCLSFQYQMSQGLQIYAGGLDVRRKTPYSARFFGENATTIYSVSSTAMRWETAEVPLLEDAGYVFIIATAVDNNLTSIDNVSLSKKLCSNSKNRCERNHFVCKFTNQCYQMSERCDGLAKCLDNSDEFNCASDNYIDFNDGTFGPGRQSSGTVRWIITSGNTPTFQTGPQMSRDHLPHLSLLHLESIPLEGNRVMDYSIPGLRMGKYAYAEMSGGQPGDLAILNFNTSARCLRFHYSAVGQRGASLSILVNEINIWRIAASQAMLTSIGMSKSGWNFAQILLPSNASDVKFVAERGLHDLGDFGLDDIVFLNSSCPEVAPCPAGTFSCKDGSCINHSLICDGSQDCGSGYDENIQLCYWATTTPRPAWYTLYNTGSTYPSSSPYSAVRKPTTVSPPVSVPTNTSAFYCREDQFQCKNGHCVNGRNRCNFLDDCKDGSDEINCQAKSCDGVMCDTGLCVQKHLLQKGDFSCPDFKDARIENLHGDCFGFTCDGFCLSWSRYCDGFSDCLDGEDERDCDCRGDQLTCDSGGCLPITAYCDQIVNCADKSDEPLTCDCYLQTSFRCGSGECINKNMSCDMKIDCMDASDEANCTCRIGQFQCSDGVCIDNSKFCDRIEHCFDGSDEPANCYCRKEQFDCGDRCIPLEKFCDGVSDCSSHADELGCDYCPSKQCGDGSCIAESLVCDGKAQCNDGVDENYCKCATDQFSCANGMCIPQHEKCDGVDQCRDFSDEENCDCAKGMAKCNSTGQCIDADFFCDGYPDCYHGEDEHGCTGSSFPGVCKANEISCNDICLPNTRSCSKAKECKQYSAVSADNQCNCGRRIITSNRTAVNEPFSSIHPWPWHVDVLYKGNSTCSGVLINNNWILTASHCISGRSSYEMDYFRFKLGSNNRTKSSKNSVFRYASGFYVHPKINPSIRSSLALFRVSSRLEFSERLLPVCLPNNQTDQYLNSTNVCFTMGWTKSHQESEYLMEQRLPGDSCFYPKADDEHVINCTLPHHFTSTNCMTEKGGPLVCLQADGRWVLQGISTSYDCQRRTYYYTRASALVDWIMAVMKESKWKD